MKQVVSIAPDGSIQSLDFKRKGLDLRKLGKAHIERTSEIVFNEDAQKWQIRFMHGTEAGKLATAGHAKVFGVERLQGAGELTEPLLFVDYEEAVSAEIELLQSARIHGLSECIAPC